VIRLSRKVSPAVASLAVTLVLILGSLASTGPAGSTAAESVAPKRQVNVWLNARPVTSASWSPASLFWFGQATGATANPSTSSPATATDYVDARIAYDIQALYVFASIDDYFLWYDPTRKSDPRSYDAFALYLDSTGDGGKTPDAADHYFVSGFRYPGTGNDVRWQRQGQGTGRGWNAQWQPSPAWTDTIGYRFNLPGPNDNSTLDHGWTTTLTIPWATLGRSGPPADGTSMGLGAIAYNRNLPVPSPVQPKEVWPASFTGAPATWATLTFNPAPYQPPMTTNPGSTVIGGGLGGAVQDTYVGGGGSCGGGIYGGGDVPHGSTTLPPPPATPNASSDPSLYVQNEADISDFPCLSKSYLQFALGAVPSGKVITSAVLTLHQYGGSGNTGAGTPQPSYIQVFALSDSWSQQTLTWDNEPLAAANYLGTWVNPYQFGGSWSAIPAITWDVTALVAAAYAANQPASLALYSADTAYDSGKYFVSSATGSWNASNYPTLTVTWGDP
jgi:hypothetical protein